MDRLVRVDRLAGSAINGRAEAFRRTVAGRAIFLIATRFEAGDDRFNECRVYHFEAEDPLDPEHLDQWMGHGPSRVETLPGVHVDRLWLTGWREGLVVHAFHIASENPLRRSLGLSGNILVAHVSGGS